MEIILENEASKLLSMLREYLLSVQFTQLYVLPSDPSIQDLSGRNSLHTAFYKEGDGEFVELLLKYARLGGIGACCCSQLRVGFIVAEPEDN